MTTLNSQRKMTKSISQKKRLFKIFGVKSKEVSDRRSDSDSEAAHKSHTQS